ncbi:MAG: cbb3-type cytochrome c oxidase subunit 3 [Alphaproteobacteria bacterium]|nr:cbb3-type cytochrome c oxidase subunit 3 [Alphaproteobacteria bacterium]
MSYEEVSTFARSWGTVYLIILFLVACGYALWPRNKATFDAAARMPLEKDNG